MRGERLCELRIENAEFEEPVFYYHPEWGCALPRCHPEPNHVMAGAEL